MKPLVRQHKRRLFAFLAMFASIILLAAACGGGDSSASSVSIERKTPPLLPAHESLPATEENADEWTCGGDLIPALEAGDIYEKVYDPSARQYVCVAYETEDSFDYGGKACREGWTAVIKEAVLAEDYGTLEKGTVIQGVRFCKREKSGIKDSPAQSVYWPGKPEIETDEKIFTPNLELSREVVCKEHSTTADINDFLNLNPGSDVSHKGVVAYEGANEFAVCPPPEMLLQAVGYEKPYWGYEKGVHGVYGWVLVSPRDCEAIPLFVKNDPINIDTSGYRLEVACEAYNYCLDLVLAGFAQISRQECDSQLNLLIHAHCNYLETEPSPPVDFFGLLAFIVSEDDTIEELQARAAASRNAWKMEKANRCRTIASFVRDSLASKTDDDLGSDGYAT